MTESSGRSLRDALETGAEVQPLATFDQSQRTSRVPKPGTDVLPARQPWGIIGFAKGAELGVAIAVGFMFVSAIVVFFARLISAALR